MTLTKRNPEKPNKNHLGLHALSAKCIPRFHSMTASLMASRKPWWMSVVLLDWAVPVVLMLMVQKSQGQPPGMYKTLWILGYLLHQLVQDFFPSTVVCSDSDSLQLFRLLSPTSLLFIFFLDKLFALCICYRTPWPSPTRLLHQNLLWTVSMILDPMLKSSEIKQLL